MLQNTASFIFAFWMLNIDIRGVFGFATILIHADTCVLIRRVLFGIPGIETT